MGYVYILSNPSYRDGIYKVGMTNRHPDDRIKELSKDTGVPTEFKRVAHYQVYNALRVESKVFELLNKFRVNKEFFEADLIIIEDRIMNAVFLTGDRVGPDSLGIHGNKFFQRSEPNYINYSHKKEKALRVVNEWRHQSHIVPATNAPVTEAEIEFDCVVKIGKDFLFKTDIGWAECHAYEVYSRGILKVKSFKTQDVLDFIVRNDCKSVLCWIYRTEENICGSFHPNGKRACSVPEYESEAEWHDDMSDWVEEIMKEMPNDPIIYCSNLL